MVKDTIQIQVPGQGDSICIILQNPWYGFKDDEITIMQDRDEPKCDWCDCDLEEADNEEDLWQEKWVCPVCSDEHWFFWGMYGEDEITLSREEWETRCATENQRYLLKKRYGTTSPQSIRDYWLETP